MQEAVDGEAEARVGAVQPLDLFGAECAAEVVEGRVAEREVHFAFGGAAVGGGHVSSSSGSGLISIVAVNPIRSAINARIAAWQDAAVPAQVRPSSVWVAV